MDDLIALLAIVMGACLVIVAWHGWVRPWYVRRQETGRPIRETSLHVGVHEVVQVDGSVTTRRAVWWVCGACGGQVYVRSSGFLTRADLEALGMVVSTPTDPTRPISVYEIPEGVCCPHCGTAFALKIHLDGELS